MLRTIAQASANTIVWNLFSNRNITNQLQSTVRDRNRLPSVADIHRSGIPGLLNKAFIPPYVFCHNEAKGGPNHIFFQCEGVINFLNRLTIDSIHPNEYVCKILSTKNSIKANEMIRLLVFMANKLKRVQLEQSTIPDTEIRFIVSFSLKIINV
ncbi:hypothetical protein CANINC_000540 [Pichia inconspicua]|uniref:Uncharacterized protein n=1 Tax=Pichia inconspicua TaxID=52247 RepID=A0A4T0X7U0_9ASCO|nr:hypothetical protein CANINC_000540 [[Candida] inconspicua]